MGHYYVDSAGVNHGPCRFCGADVRHTARGEPHAEAPARVPLLMDGSLIGFAKHDQTTTEYEHLECAR